MAQIFQTTLVPSKLELIGDWLARQSWYARPGKEPELTPVGGFRLDDPDGEVGLEFHFVRDADSTVYQVPVSYRGAALDDAEHGRIGTMEHGVLGTRWVYDGAHDPVLVAQLIALASGATEAQDQHQSDTADPTVSVEWTGSSAPAATIRRVTHSPGETVVHVGEHGGEPHFLRIVRLLQAEDVQAPPGTHEASGTVRAEWTGPGDVRLRGPVALLT
jgi:hypothetical protein